MYFDKINALNYAIRLKDHIHESTSSQLSTVRSNDIHLVTSSGAGILMDGAWYGYGIFKGDMQQRDLVKLKVVSQWLNLG